MAQVEVTVVACEIEGPLWIEPFPCPCCGELLVVDRMKDMGTTETGHRRYEMSAVKNP